VVNAVPGTLPAGIFPREPHSEEAEVSGQRPRAAINDPQKLNWDEPE